MSQWIISAHNHNLTNLVYYGTMAAGIAGELITALVLSKKYKEKVWKAFVVWLITTPVLFLWMKVQFWIESGFKSFTGYNIVRTFVWFPLASWVVAVFLDANYRKIWDAFAPASVMIQALAHWGCAFMGCCYGIPMKNGIYNVVQKDYRFPVQIVEALVSLAIYVFLMIRTKRKNYESDGTQFPWFLILFGSTRFFLEFLRDNQKLFLGISSLALHALLMVIVGAIWLYIHKKRALEAPKKVVVSNKKKRKKRK